MPAVPAAHRLARRALLLAGALTLSGAVVLAAAGRRKAPEAPRPARMCAGLELLSPALTPGQVTDLDRADVQVWRGSAPLEHQLVGQVRLPGQTLHVRPWLYTACWVPQPVAQVGPDGRFEARIFIDARYDDPFVLRLEVEDRATRTVIGTQDYFLKRLATGDQP